MRPGEGCAVVALPADDLDALAWRFAGIGHRLTTYPAAEFPRLGPALASVYKSIGKNGITADDVSLYPFLRLDVLLIPE